MKIAIYETATGRIVRTLTGFTLWEAGAHIVEGEAATLIDVSISDETHYISGAEPVEFPARPSRLHQWDWGAMAWIDPRPIEHVRIAALSKIDAAAGRARLRYITDVPGQGAVYLRKLEQAQAFAEAGYTEDVPPYIAAESAATGMSPQQAADRILLIASQWDSVLSPAIEGARIGGKQATESASTILAIETARDAAISALDAI